MARRRYPYGDRPHPVRTSRTGAFVTLLCAATLAACGGDATSPHPRFDLVDRWGSSFELSESGGLVRRYELTLEIGVVSGEIVTGSATLDPRTTLSGDGAAFTLSGRYRPPVLFVELRSETWSQLRFVGEVTTRNVIEGTLVADTPEAAPSTVLLFRR